MHSLMGITLKPESRSLPLFLLSDGSALQLQSEGSVPLARGVGSEFCTVHSSEPEMWCGTEAGSYLRLIDSCITQLTAQGPARTCNESKEEEEGVRSLCTVHSSEPAVTPKPLLILGAAAPCRTILKREIKVREPSASEKRRTLPLRNEPSRGCGVGSFRHPFD